MSSMISWVCIPYLDHGGHCIASWIHQCSSLFYTSLLSLNEYPALSSFLYKGGGAVAPFRELRPRYGGKVSILEIHLPFLLP